MVDLAIRIERHLKDSCNTCGDHIVGQKATTPLEGHFLMGPTDHECHTSKCRSVCIYWPRQHGDHVRTGRFSNSILDFLELYAEAANLHLPIYTSKIRVAFLTDVASKVSSS